MRTSDLRDCLNKLAPPLGENYRRSRVQGVLHAHYKTGAFGVPITMVELKRCLQVGLSTGLVAGAVTCDGSFAVPVAVLRGVGDIDLEVGHRQRVMLQPIVGKCPEVVAEVTRLRVFRNVRRKSGDRVGPTV